MANNYSSKVKEPQGRSIQPWQMTAGAWVEFCAHRYVEVFHEELCDLSKKMAIIIHHIAVKDAMRTGEDVAFEVYSQYPELIALEPEFSDDEEISFDSNGGA